MTKEQFDKLSKFKDSFIEARSNYYRSLLMSEAQEMNDVWEELGHERALITCGKCVLTLLQKLGNEYFEYEKELNERTVQETIKTKPKKNAKKMQK